MKISKEELHAKKRIYFAKIVSDLLAKSMNMQGHHFWICLKDGKLDVFALGSFPAGFVPVFDLTKYQSHSAGVLGEVRRLLSIITNKIEGGEL